MMNKKQNLARVTLNLPTELLSGIDDIANHNRRTRTAEFVLALEAYLNGYKL